MGFFAFFLSITKDINKNIVKWGRKAMFSVWIYMNSNICRSVQIAYWQIDVIPQGY